MSVLLTGCGRGYKMENGRWAWVSWDEAAGRRTVFLEGVDNASFHRLSRPDYAADKSSVFHKNLKVPGADPASFRSLEGAYWRDAKKVYLDGSEIVGADPETFKLLSKPGWSCDKKDVYTGMTALHVRDVSSFTLLQGVWAKDDKAYYANGALLAYKTVPCDYSTFVILNGSYAKDKDRGYWQGMPIEHSDGPSFQALNEFLARDKDHEYSGARERNTE